MIIQRLKERIAQLDVENSLLTKASSTTSDDAGVINDDNDDLDTLLKRIAKLKVLIRVANDRFGKSLTIEGKKKKKQTTFIFSFDLNRCFEY